MPKTTVNLATAPNKVACFLCCSGSNNDTNLQACQKRSAGLRGKAEGTNDEVLGRCKTYVF